MNALSPLVVLPDALSPYGKRYFVTLGKEENTNFKKWCKRSGVSHACADSFDEVRQALTSWGAVVE
jgi:hypothetical protein